MNPSILKLNLNEAVMEWHNKGLSIFGISQKLGIKYWEAEKIIESEIKKDRFTLGLS